MLASVPHALFFPDVSCNPVSSCAFWFQPGRVACYSPCFRLSSECLKIRYLALSERFSFPWCFPGAASAVIKVKARVKFYLPLFFRRFRSVRRQRYFHRQWGACGVVASVVAGQLSLTL